MRTATIRFEPAGWEIEIYPATDENEEYVRIMKATAFPHQLAIDLGKLSDERAYGILAQVVAETVIMGSPTPGLPENAADWQTWLLEHPEELETILLTARLPDDWEEMAGGTTDVQGLR
jgi:hypothetical protein